MALNGNGYSKQQLATRVEHLERVQANCLRIVFNASRQIGEVLDVELLDGGASDGFEAFRLNGDNVTLVIAPFAETVTFHDPDANIPSVTFHTPDGAMSKPDQLMLLGLIVAAKRASVDQRDPIAGTLSLTGVADTVAA